MITIRIQRPISFNVWFFTWFFTFWTSGVLAMYWPQQSLASGLIAILIGVILLRMTAVDNKESPIKFFVGVALMLFAIHAIIDGVIFRAFFQ